MKRLIGLIIILCGLSVVNVSAQATGRISSFTSSVNQVGRTALVGGTARIPVSWTAENRPFSSTLVFDQVMPDGNTVNVELPRPFQWVNSSDSGLVAPILPSGDVSSITLRVSLINIFSGYIYDSREIVLAIVPGDAGSNGDTSDVMALSNFTATYSAPVNRTELDNGTVRIPVSWTAINRPYFANLVFEQVLPDGTVVNVELPRPFQWVNSSGSGLVAPQSVGDADEIVLRVRLADISWDRSYDVLYAYVPVQSQSTGNPPDITSFSSPVSSISVDEVVDGNGYIDVSWSVSNRPDETNLVFEQVLPGGELRNAELPRDMPIVPSSGNGVVLAVMPDSDVTELRFRVRLIDLSNNNTLDSADLTVALIDDSNVDLSIDSFTISPDSINGADLATTNFTFSWTTSGAVDVRLDPVFFDNSQVDGSITVPGSSFDSINSSHEFTLIAYDSDGNSTEMSATLQVDSALVINDFSVSPDSTRGNNQVTFSWDISGDFRDAYVEYPVQFTPEALFTIDSNTGSQDYTIPDWVWAEEKTVTLHVEDEFGTVVSRDITLNIDCTYVWQMAVDETGCASAYISRVGAYQQFQRGFMLWMPRSSGEVIYVFYTDGSAGAYSDTWDGSDYVIDGTPPDGLIAPERGFGYIWNTNPEVRSGLGWATSDEQSYTIDSQARFHYLRNDPTYTYYSLPDGRIVRLDSTGGLYPTRTWVNATS